MSAPITKHDTEIRSVSHVENIIPAVLAIGEPLARETRPRRMPCFGSFHRANTRHSSPGGGEMLEAGKEQDEGEEEVSSSGRCWRRTQ